MRRLARLVPALAALLLAGCGGEGGIGRIYSATAAPTVLATGANSTVVAVVVEGGVTTYAFAVREGAAGGAVVQGAGADANKAVYTAPSTAGVYHVDVRFLNGTDEVAKRTVTLTVSTS